MGVRRLQEELSYRIFFAVLWWFLGSLCSLRPKSDSQIHLLSQPRKALTTHAEIRYFFRCVWYSQLAADTSIAFHVCCWWMNGESSPFSIQGRLSECSRIMAAKTLKNPYGISDIQIFLKEEVNQNTKRKNRYVFSALGNGISHRWERKSIAGRLLNFCCVSERFLQSVRTRAITENFVNWKLRPILLLERFNAFFHLEL